MKTLSVMFIAVTVLIGLYDGGNITGALVLALLILPGVFKKERNEENVLQ